ncbi:SsgA family sporulation/cell division regulator [Streptomyces sp. NBC_01136]|uniref:SsgA family sporulation/cell division regulator n=1 Tax=unclassified Streptomyces TaxID=2593676 RepID=UPI00324D2C2B|nr:SsgA family sporulation/cell division regulator [Streptomyces sp. NBC_01136]
MTRYVDQVLYMELVLTPEERGVTVLTRLRYDPHDPFAVSVVFHTDVNGSVPWFFARDLLARGVLRPSGQGDVQVWPTGEGPDAVLNLALSSPHGAARLTAPLAVVTQWLDRTYRLVPMGRETDGLDFDAELSRLLHGAA